MVSKKRPSVDRDDVLYGNNTVTDRVFGTRFAPYGVSVRGGQMSDSPAKKPYMSILNEGELAKLRPMTTKSGESVGVQSKDVVTKNGQTYAKAGSKTVSSKALMREKGVKQRAALKAKALASKRRES